MFQSRKHYLFARLLNLACQKHLVQDRVDLIHHQHKPIKSLALQTHLVEIKHQIQLAHIPKELIQHLHEEMYRLEVR